MANNSRLARIGCQGMSNRGANALSAASGARGVIRNRLRNKGLETKTKKIEVKVKDTFIGNPCYSRPYMCRPSDG